MWPKGVICIDIYRIREELRTKNISDVPLRVTFYARVSTDKEEQENSLNNQKQYYNEFIKSNPAWTYIDGYIDEGISGLSTRKREQFNKMIEDGKRGEYDFIITKEITRFARNTLDSILYTRELLQNGVAVWFQSDSINTIDEDSELRLTIMAGVAQDDSRRTSARVKFGHRQAIKNGVVLGNSRIFGYDKNKGRLVINENEADMIRELFELYATGEYSMKQIENLFWEKGFRNRNGNKIAHSTMSNIISNPKYKGWYCGGKVKVVDMFTKKQKFMPESEWTMWKDENGDIVPAIVSEELWQAANQVLSKRSSVVKSRETTIKDNLYTGKIICMKHDTPYYLKGNVLKNGERHYYWVCSHKLKNGADSCQSVPIYEDELNDILVSLIQMLGNNKEQVIKKYLEYYSQSQSDEDIGKKIQSMESEIDLIEKKKEKILEYNLDGKISDTEFIKRNNSFNDQLLVMEQEKEILKKQQVAQFDYYKSIREIEGFIQDLLKGTERIAITKQTIDTLIDKIFVSQNIGGETELFVRLKTMDEYEFIKSRSGHMFKKMIESYERGMH